MQIAQDHRYLEFGGQCATQWDIRVRPLSWGAQNAWGQDSLTHRIGEGLKMLVERSIDVDATINVPERVDQRASKLRCMLVAGWGATPAPAR